MVPTACAAVPVGLLIPRSGLIPLFLVLALLYIAGGPYQGSVPTMLPVLWIAVLGTGTGDVKVGGTTVPMIYVLLVVIIARQGLAGAGLRPQSKEALRATHWPMLVTFLIAPAFAMAIVGLANGNPTALVRTEFVALSVAGAVALITVRAHRGPADLSRLGVALCACGVVAATKTILIAGLGLTSPVLGRTLFGTYSNVNPQFGNQRVIPIGGDTVMALTLPLMVMLAMRGRGRLSAFGLTASAVTTVGLVLTYTRGLIVAAAIGSLVALAALHTVANEKRHRGRAGVKLVLGAVAVLGLLSFSYGRSSNDAAGALSARFSGGSARGASLFIERTDEARAAMHSLPAAILGSGLGAQFRSTLPGIGVTNYVHIGYAWLIFKGGLFVLAAACLVLGWAYRRLSSAARKTNASATLTLSLAGFAGSLAAFASMNVILNRVASVEGMIFFAIYVTVAYVVSLPQSVGERAHAVVCIPEIR
jgi:hypothetical protein